MPAETLDGGVHRVEHEEYDREGSYQSFRRLVGRVLQFAALLLAYLSSKLLAATWQAIQSGALKARVLEALTYSPQIPLIPAMSACALAIALFAVWFRRRRWVYCLDFACYRPPESLQVTRAKFIEHSRLLGVFNEEELSFQERILARNGVGEETCFPAGLHMMPPVINMETAREESEMAMFTAVREALDKTGLAPREIDVLVVNCSLFSPTPSLSAMIIQHFGMRTDIQSFNLSGMGCSAGIIAIGLAQRMLSETPGQNALVVSTESCTLNWYHGQERSMLIPNTLFRLGGAAIILTNKPRLVRRAKYRLEHLVRVHMGADEKAYRCVYQHPDAKGCVGVELNRDLVKVAAGALTKNLTRLGPKVLPLSEKLQYAINWLYRRLADPKYPAYVPNFTKAFNHFCLHAGGRAVIEGLGSQLGLSERQQQPAKNALYWYGNTSSSSIWYGLGFVESCQAVRKGDTVFQIGFGSGFKCNSAAWRAMRDIKGEDHVAWRHITSGQKKAV